MSCVWPFWFEILCFYRSGSLGPLLGSFGVLEVPQGNLSLATFLTLLQVRSHLLLALTLRPDSRRSLLEVILFREKESIRVFGHLA